MKKANLKQIVEEFELVASLSEGDTALYYNRNTGELRQTGHMMRDGLGMSQEEYEDYLFELDKPEWFALPEKFDIDQYRMMHEFADEQDNRIAEELHDQVGGRGTFRRFRNTAERHGLLDEWRAFHEHAMMKEMARWCDKNDIPYDPLPEIAQTMQSTTITQSVGRDPKTTFAFVSNVRNWRMTLVHDLQKTGTGWGFNSPDGPYVLTPSTVPLAGVFDFKLHHGKSGMEIPVAFRVAPNGEGSELIMTIFRPPELRRHLSENLVVWLRNGLQNFRADLESSGTA